MIRAPFFRRYFPSMNKRENPIFKVIFQSQGQVFEIYAKQIFQSELWGFLEVEELVFGERSQMLVDPSEEKLKAQFDGVLREHYPLADGTRANLVVMSILKREWLLAEAQRQSRLAAQAGAQDPSLGEFMDAALADIARDVDEKAG